MTTKNGKQIGLEHLSTLDAFLVKGGQLPVSSRDGSLNLAELARVTGIPKSSFYQNPKVKERLETARESHGVSRQGERPAPQSDDAPASADVKAPSAIGATTLLERRLHRLEQQNAALVAENYEMRRQLKDLRLQLGREDMTIETGRRVAVPSEEA